jgi:type II secretory pathway pseudopilin PulG
MMFKDIRSRLYHDDGFSLLQLVIVVAIIGILAVTAMPAFSSYRDRARMAALIVVGNSVRGALSSLAADDAQTLYPTDVTIDTLNAGGASLSSLGYTLTYTPSGTPTRTSFKALLEHNATGKQVCITPERTQKTAGGVCS